MKLNAKMREMINEKENKHNRTNLSAMQVVKATGQTIGLSE